MVTPCSSIGSAAYQVHAAVAFHAVEERIDQVHDARFHRLDPGAGEDRLDEVPESTVIGAVEVEHVLGKGGEKTRRPGCTGLTVGDVARVLDHPGVPQTVHDVGVPGDDPGLPAIRKPHVRHRVIPAQPFVVTEGIPLELGCPQGKCDPVRGRTTPRRHGVTPGPARMRGRIRVCPPRFRRPPRPPSSVGGSPRRVPCRFLPGPRAPRA